MMEFLHVIKICLTEGANHRSPMDGAYLAVPQESRLAKLPRELLDLVLYYLKGFLNLGKEFHVALCGHPDAGKTVLSDRLYAHLGSSQREQEFWTRKSEDTGSCFDYVTQMVREEQSLRDSSGERTIQPNRKFPAKDRGYSRWFIAHDLSTGPSINLIKNTMHSLYKAKVAILMVPADAKFPTGIARDGLSRRHALLAHLLGIPLLVCVNKMDTESASYREERFNEICVEVNKMLIKIGYTKQFVKDCIPKIPVSAWQGDNVVDASHQMAWWKGANIKIGICGFHIHTVWDALQCMTSLDLVDPDAPLRASIVGLYKIKGHGELVSSEIVQGTIHQGSQVLFIPTHTKKHPCTGIVHAILPRDTRLIITPQKSATCGEHVEINIKGLKKENMPKSGDVMVLMGDPLTRPKSFTAVFHVIECPPDFEIGSPAIALGRSNRAAVKMMKINWKYKKRRTHQGRRIEDPDSFKVKDVVEVVFSVENQFVVDVFKKCPGLGRVTVFNYGTLLMIGDVIEVAT